MMTMMMMMITNMNLLQIIIIIW